MSKIHETVGATPSHEEMEAALKAARTLRSEAFLDFFGFAGQRTEARPARRSVLPLAIFNEIRLGTSSR